mgnify:CR=1 FL=1
MILEKFKDTEYIKCVNLLAELVELDADEKEKIRKCLLSMGIKHFFLHLELMGLASVTSEKLKSIKSIIDIFDEEGGQA